MAKKKSTKATAQARAQRKQNPAAAPKTVTRKRPSAAPADRLKVIDKQLVQLLKDRVRFTVAHLQSLEDRRDLWFDPNVEAQLWEELEQVNQGELAKEVLRGVFREVLCAARIKVKSVRVAYLGPPFSFTHLAALEKFGKTADLVPVNSIASVFEEVNKGHAEFGIVPIENSTDGRIVDTLDMFTRLPLRICGEVQISVHHNLLSRSPRSEITEIYSKPQALSQCRDWLARNMPQAKIYDVTSTSTAAALAQTKPGAAAIASRQAAVQYSLNIVAETIEDNAHNVTRFAIIGDHDTNQTGRDRTALLLQIPHSPGSLTDALTAFKNNKINLTWIESFPLRGPESGYLFFLDFEGHIKEPRIKKALQLLEKKAVRMEVLGSYPRSEAIV
ncbi:MAG TPA: prephenate dehydratase [Planctomicrobium sp.]|nr:prephenate dehydratase [Planctomicrobium sp.]